jgi:glycosyltransferase involved in cell wall biosynthesis
MTAYEIRSTPDETVDVLVCTFNSARTLSECLASAQRNLPVHRLIVVDRHSTDRTAEIAREFGAEIHLEDVGLGRSRSLAIEVSSTEFVLFLDSDVELVRPDFYARALEQMARPGTAAVVGGSVGYPFLYGLPLSLTLFRRDWVRRVAIPPTVQGRETYFLQRALRRERQKVRYVADAIRHGGTYRSFRFWPEFQGAWVRRTAGFSLREISYSFLVSLLVQANSRRPRNLAYTPIFCLKLLRGFLQPQRWDQVDRRSVDLPP